MSRFRGSIIFALVIWSGFAAFGFHALDRSNRWGSEAYTIVTAGVLAILMGLPFLAHPKLLLWQRLLFSAALALFTLLVWFGAVLAAILFGSLGISF